MAENKTKCAICSSYLFEDDDVVHCPVCGAPHHRDCYNFVGHCGLEELHGTDKQYSPPAADSEEPEKDSAETGKSDREDYCKACGQQLTGDRQFCAHCGAPANGQPPFAGGMFGTPVQIKEDTVVDEGVTAKEVAETVAVNPIRYITKFLTMATTGKKGWNWAAFLLPGGWFAYRKMYKESILTTLMLIASYLCNIPFNLAINTLPQPGDSVTNYMQLGQYYAQYIDQIGTLPLLLVAAGLVIGIITRIVSGIVGDRIYKGRVLETAKKARELSGDERAEHLRKKGGVSLIGFLIAVMAIEFLPSVIQILIMM